MGSSSLGRHPPSPHPLPTPTQTHHHQHFYEFFVGLCKGLDNLEGVEVVRLCTREGIAVSQQKGREGLSRLFCLFVSIQGQLPKREAELSTPPLSGPTSADQSPPLLHFSRGKLGEGESDSKGRESLCVRVCARMHDRERERGRERRKCK